MASTGLSSKSRWLRTLTETAVRDRISWRGMLVLSSFWFAIAYSMQPLGGNIIPLLVTRFTTPTTFILGPLAIPLDVNTYVSLLDTIGAAFAIVWQPAIGALSDNSRFRLGRRRPFIAIAGALVIFGVPDRRRTTVSDHPVGRSIVLSFAIDARKYRDFAWLMVSRLFFLMGVVGISTYAFNFIRFTFHYSEGKASLYSSALQAVVVVFAAVLAMTAGFLVMVGIVTAFYLSALVTLRPVREIKVE